MAPNAGVVLLLTLDVVLVEMATESHGPRCRLRQRCFFWPSVSSSASVGLAMLLAQRVVVFGQRGLLMLLALGRRPRPAGASVWPSVSSSASVVASSGLRRRPRRAWVLASGLRRRPRPGDASSGLRRRPRPACALLALGVLLGLADLLVRHVRPSFWVGVLLLGLTFLLHTRPCNPGDCRLRDSGGVGFSTGFRRAPLAG